MLSTSLVLQICFMTMSAKIAVKFLHQTSLLKFAYKLYSSVLVLSNLLQAPGGRITWKVPTGCRDGLVLSASDLSTFLPGPNSNVVTLQSKFAGVCLFFWTKMVVLPGKYCPWPPNTSQCNNLQLVVICDRVKWTHTQLMVSNCTGLQVYVFSFNSSSCIKFMLLVVHYCKCAPQDWRCLLWCICELSPQH